MSRLHLLAITGHQHLLTLWPCALKRMLMRGRSARKFWRYAALLYYCRFCVPSLISSRVSLISIVCVEYCGVAKFMHGVVRCRCGVWLLQHQFIIASQSTRLLLDLVKRTRHAVKKENTKQYYRAKRLLMHDENGVTEQALPDVVGEEPEEDGDSVSTLSLWHRSTCEHLSLGSIWTWTM